MVVFSYLLVNTISAASAKKYSEFDFIQLFKNNSGALYDQNDDTIAELRIVLIHADKT